jgi:parallel beta-helix repeat protein
MIKRFLLMLIVSLFLTAGLARSIYALPCNFATSGKTMTLTNDCTTSVSIIVPNGFTLDGAGHTITAEDPVGGHFVGGVIQNGGATANVTNVKITTNLLADVCDAGVNRLRGILFDGASGNITDNVVTNINQNQGAVFSGCQEGNAIEVRNFGLSPTTVRARIDGNTISGYQKTGIVVNGDADGTVTDNTVTGDGPQDHIAQNGIQIGFGATAQVKHNQVSGNAYTGGDVSGGILVVAGPFYGSAYSVGDQIINNTLTGNDIGVWLSQIDAATNPPTTATNAKVVGNIISNSAVTNGLVYQAGIADQGNNDKIINNTISGAGYDPNTPPGSTFAIDADTSFTNRPKVHANK